ncbi:hypothetical protein LTR16_008171, partial [Cryomyces antarcticus]
FEAHLRTRRGQGEELYVWSESRQAWGEVINAFGRTHPYVVIIIARNEMADIHVDDENDVPEDYGPGLWEVFPEEDNDDGMELEDLDDVPKAADPALLAAVAALPRRRFVQSPKPTTDPDAMQSTPPNLNAPSVRAASKRQREPLIASPPSCSASPLPSDTEMEGEVHGSDEGQPASIPEAPDTRLDHARLEEDRWDFNVDLIYAQLDYLEQDIRNVLHRPST